MWAFRPRRPKQGRSGEFLRWGWGEPLGRPHDPLLSGRRPLGVTNASRCRSRCRWRVLPPNCLRPILSPRVSSGCRGPRAVVPKPIGFASVRGRNSSCQRRPAETRALGSLAARLPCCGVIMPLRCVGFARGIPRLKPLGTALERLWGVPTKRAGCEVTDGPSVETMGGAGLNGPRQGQLVRTKNTVNFWSPLPKVQVRRPVSFTRASRVCLEP